MRGRTPFFSAADDGWQPGRPAMAGFTIALRSVGRPLELHGVTAKTLFRIGIVGFDGSIYSLINRPCMTAFAGGAFAVRNADDIFIGFRTFRFMAVGTARLQAGVG